MSLEKSLKDTIKDKEDKVKGGFGIGSILESVSPFLVFINLPLAITAGATGLAIDAISKKKNLKSAMMPDEWLKQVADSPYVSEKGLAFLKKSLGDNESISVSDALIFLEIENEHEKESKQEEKKSKENKVKNNKEGFMALKNRLNDVNKTTEEPKKSIPKEIVKNVVEVGPRAVGLFLAIKGNKTLKK